MKFINLVLYSKDETYDKMKKITEKYYNTLDNVITIYYCFNNDIKEKYKLDGNFLYFKGEETYEPGITIKTIKAFEFIKKNNYIFDYIIRSNISTIVDFKLLEEELIKKPIKYYGGGLAYIDYGENKLNFISGTSIILSKLGLNFLLNNKNKHDFNIIDDVYIGIIFTKFCKYFKNNKLEQIGRFDFINKDFLYKIILKKKNLIFYRNHNGDRSIDLVNMKFIINYLLSKKMIKLFIINI